MAEIRRWLRSDDNSSDPLALDKSGAISYGQPIAASSSLRPIDGSQPKSGPRKITRNLILDFATFV
jgi:hypothetical protein